MVSKQCEIQPYSGILLKQTNQLDKTDKFLKHSEQKKSDAKEYIPYDSVYMKLE